MNENNNSNEFRRKLFEKLHGISSQFKINYPINPNLKYEYPELNPIILENIVNALIACPRFYVQTLHLMNKMNLPCPLVDYVRVPRPNMYKEINLSFNSSKVSPIRTEINTEQVDMSTSSESDSELETDESNNLKERSDSTKSIESKPKKIKIKSFLTGNKRLSNKISSCIDIGQVFEKKFELKSKSIVINVKQDELLINKNPIQPTENEGFAKIAPINSNLSDQIDEKQNDAEKITEIDKYISQNDLEKNRLKITELKELAVFKNYEKGEPNSRLYVKNISKKAQENDLKYIYGRYINWQDETHQNSFDIRLMKEGRMKGQAFITLPNEQLAEKALNDTNGYLLDDKPLVVQFARSAKLK